MEKQMPTLVDFFFIQLFFDWVARVQKLLSKSNVHDRSSVCKDAASHGCSQRRISANNKSEECDDIKLVMGRLGLALDEESEGKKVVAFDDISTLFDQTEPCLDEIKAAFSVFDQNNDGFIDEKELKRVMCALGLKEGMGLETCRKMIRDYDVNDDGLIDFSEFVKVVEKSFC